MLLLTPTEYVRYTAIREIEQGARNVAIPKKNKLIDS
jgi:hypothetical protein